MVSKNLYNAPGIKPLAFVGSSRDDLAGCPEPVRRNAGYELWQVQIGAMPSDWRPMPSVGLGALEIRVHVAGEWRVIYVAKFERAVYVLHVFQKKSQQTARRDIETARRRYRLIGDPA